MSDRARNSEDAWAQVADELDDANGKISALRSRVAVLEGALRPFAEEAARWSEYKGDSLADQGRIGCYIPLTAIFSARAALTKEPTP